MYCTEGTNIKDEFERILTTDRGQLHSRLLMFGAAPTGGVDFFRACCRHYGSQEWDLGNTLLLYGVLLQRYLSARNMDKKFLQRLQQRLKKRFRKLRNLILASGDRIRVDNMPALLVDVRQVILKGATAAVSTFNQAQKQNELDKAGMLRANSRMLDAVHRLEDHDLLRGGLMAFDLDPSRFESRADAFIKVFNKSAYAENHPWLDVTGALLVQGTYSRRQEERWTGYAFADFAAPNSDEPWRTLFRRMGSSQAEPPIRKPLMSLLDAVAKGYTLKQIIKLYLEDHRTVKDWRYYLVKYPAMRKGASGRYAFSDSGYKACMLDRQRMSSYYFDPYLLAAVKASGISDQAIANPNWPRAYYGYENGQRWLELRGKGIKLRSVDYGWEVSGIVANQLDMWIQDTAIQGVQIIYQNNNNNTLLIQVNQVYRNGRGHPIDTIDRIALAASLLKYLVETGF